MESASVSNQVSIRKLKLAFCLYKYFPQGGLQLDFLHIAKDCQRRGHEIRVYTLEWVGDIPDGFEVITVPVYALTNHTRKERFSVWVNDALYRDPVDGVIGINKMPGLDVYYAADSCYEEKMQTQRGWLDRQFPRYHHFASYEDSVFGKDSLTEILMISDVQRPFFEKHYGTSRDRMHFLPPGISSDRIAPENVDEIRSQMRAELGVADDEYMLLTVGSGFIKKGVSRALHAQRSLPAEIREKTKYFIVGRDTPGPFKRLIFRLGLRKRVTIFSEGCDPNDIPRFLFAADLLIHPATDESAGIILIEAVVAGLPVLATDNCGYGHFVEEAEVGSLVKSPFEQKALNTKLLEMLQSERRNECLENGRRFAKHANIYSLHQEASYHIERVIFERSTQIGHKHTLAFTLYKYMTFGGLQLDFIRIATECQRRGYKIRVYTVSWEGQVPLDFDVLIVPVKSVTNHSRNQKFTEWVGNHLKEYPVNSVVGFNKMPGLDIYYAADTCYAEKMQTQRSWYHRQLPRHHHFAKYEQAVFDRSAETEILMISEVQKPLFLKYYGTKEERFHLLPPGILRDRRAPTNAADIRKELRQEFSIAADDFLLLMVGSGFITKGLDRILLGIASLPEEVRNRTSLVAIGQDSPKNFERMAHRLGISNRIQILKGRDDITRFLLGADLLVHPAYLENTGTVLLEAIVAGLPVLATDVCGYAHYIKEAGAGRLVPSPYEQKIFNQQLLGLITESDLKLLQQKGLAFAGHADIYSMPQRAADFICQYAQQKHPESAGSKLQVIDN